MHLTARPPLYEIATILLEYLHLRVKKTLDEDGPEIVQERASLVKSTGDEGLKKSGRKFFIFFYLRK